jgi:hypothetical protein
VKPHVEEKGVERLLNPPSPLFEEKEGALKLLKHPMLRKRGGEKAQKNHIWRKRKGEKAPESPNWKKERGSGGF